MAFFVGEENIPKISLNTPVHFNEIKRYSNSLFLSAIGVFMQLLLTKARILRRRSFHLCGLEDFAHLRFVGVQGRYDVFLFGNKDLQ